MKYRQVEAFKAIMETGTVTAAAERLNISQPAASKLLLQLERSLGFPVFERIRGRLVATPDARAFHHQVERAFVGMDQLARFVTDLRDLRQGRLVIGCMPSLSLRWMPAAVASFVRQHADVTISLVVRSSGELRVLVANHQVDTAVAHMAEPDALDSGVTRRPLMELEAVCICPAGHRLARVALVQPSDFDDETFISLGLLDQSRQDIDAVMAVAGVKRRLRLDTGSAATVCGLVAENLGVALVDTVTAASHRHLGLAIRPFRPRVAFGISILEPRQQPRSRLARVFIGHLRQYAARLTEVSDSSLFTIGRARS